MPLVTMASLLERAEQEQYGIGAFSVANMEMIIGAVRAAEALQSPLILQIAQVRLPYSPLSLIAPMMVAAAKNAAVPVAVHFDHGTDLAVIRHALQLGFTSVMFDGSSLPLAENIRLTRQVRELADAYGASVEAEVGQLAGSEDGSEEMEMIYSKPEQVQELAEQTRVDAVAVSIGNSHGLYKKEPKLSFEVLRKSKELAKLPLVLHGGSGISEEDFKRCIEEGIRKINVATASFMAYEQAARAYARTDKRDYFALSAAEVEAVQKNVAAHMKIFGSTGRCRRMEYIK